jgi:lysophospholipid acyltransferase (LPLAT)-like uncharacterized protein
VAKKTENPLLFEVLKQTRILIMLTWTGTALALPFDPIRITYCRATESGCMKKNSWIQIELPEEKAWGKRGG